VTSVIVHSAPLLSSDRTVPLITVPAREQTWMTGKRPAVGAWQTQPSL